MLCPSGSNKPTHLFCFGYIFTLLFYNSVYNCNTFVLNINGNNREKENKPDCNGAPAPLQYGKFYIAVNEWGENITETKNEFKKGGATLICPSSIYFTVDFSFLSKGMETSVDRLLY